MRKPKSIRSKIIILLVIPVVALSGLWGLNVQASVTDALALRGAYSSRDQVGRPCDLMLQALQGERSQTQKALAVTPMNVDTVRIERAATDTAAAEFRRLAAQYDAEGDAADITRDRISEMMAGLDSLPGVREQIDAGGMTRARALGAYNGMISSAFAVLSAAASFSDLLVERVMHTVVAIRQVGELFSQEDALLTGAATAGRFGSGEYLQFIKTVGALRFQLPAAGAGLPESEKSAYFSMLANPSFAALKETEDRVIRDGRPSGPVPLTPEVWNATYDPVAKQIFDFVAEGYDKAIEYARAAADRVLKRFGLAGGVGMLAILLSLILSVRIGRSVVDRLSELRASANDLASRGLPQVVARLRAGEQVPVDTDVPSPPRDGDEIADVAFALSQVRRSAIESAVGEAALRRGMGKVLVNIARRNQTLIDRQLRALAQIRTSDSSAESAPAAVAGQLAMRMRRHAEHLVILAGSARSQGGVRSVPLAEIITSAAGEVEDPGRVEIRSITDTRVPGRAAPDIVHMLTELLENATAFSPPDTGVRISAHRAPYGVAVEIEDRGLGMSPTAIEETNRMMAEPPGFDPANSSRLGLFVVAQLAAQRGIRVFLQPSEYGGVTASVTLPPELVDASPGPVPAPQGQPAMSR